MATTASPFESITALLTAVMQGLHDETQTWSSRWQHACQEIWRVAETRVVTRLDQELVDRFCCMMLDYPHLFGLARLAIPELRAISACTPTASANTIPRLQERIREAVLPIALCDPLRLRQQDYDSESLKQEKEIFAQSEMLRARLLRQAQTEYAAVSATAIDDWLALRPTAVVEPSPSTAPTSAAEQAERFTDAELHRARIFLHLDSPYRAADGDISRWLAHRPCS